MLQLSHVLDVASVGIDVCTDSVVYILLPNAVDSRTAVGMGIGILVRSHRYSLRCNHLLLRDLSRCC